MSIGIIIQARLESRRFRGKVLRDISGRPMIWHIIQRCKRVGDKVDVVLAISKRKADNPLLKIANDCGVSCYRGSANDVLSRYFKCAQEFGMDPIVRITGDCPLIDVNTINEIIQVYLSSNCDYVRTGISYPEGLNVEVFSFKSLAIAFRDANLPSEREHVTPYIWKNPSIFTSQNIEFETDLTNYRLVVDYEEDLLFIQEIYDRLYPKNEFFSFRDVINLLKNNTDLIEKMPTPKRLEGYYLSLNQDL